MSELIDRQAAIDAIEKMNIPEDMCVFEILSHIELEIATLPTIQPEPSIPLSWIEKYIEWLKSIDNEFAKLVVGYISIMLKKWRDEKK